LKDALKSYTGTLILVSHDRDFLQGLSDTVYEFKDGIIKEHLGDINFFMEQKKMEDMRLLEKKEAKSVHNSIIGSQKANKSNWKSEREKEKKQKRLKNQIKNIEKEITSIEQKIEEFDQILSTSSGYNEMVASAGSFESYEKHKSTLEELVIKWEELESDLEELI